MCVKVVGRVRIYEREVRRKNKTYRYRYYYILVPKRLRDVEPFSIIIDKGTTTIRIDNIKFSTNVVKINKTYYISIPKTIFRTFPELVKKIENKEIEYEILQPSQESFG